MARQCSQKKFIDALQSLKVSATPILFSLSARWPAWTATGHGLIRDLTDKGFTVVGTAGLLSITFDSLTHFYISGHYQLTDAQRTVLPADLYFHRLKRVRAMTIQTKHNEANLIFAIGSNRGDSRSANATIASTGTRRR